MLSVETAKPGDTIWAGVDMKMEPGWHTYWKNPGDAGMATKIQWQLPPGISAGDIQWPLPDKFPPVEVTTYGYENETMLLVPLTIESNMPMGMVGLKANVSWLECKDVCIPASQDVEAALNIGNETKASADAAAIDAWRQKVPESENSKDWSDAAWWEKPADDDTRSLIIDRHFLGAMTRTIPVVNADFFPEASDNFEIQPTAEKLLVSAYEIKLRLAVKKYSGDWPKEISGVLVAENRGRTNGVAVTFPISGQAPAGMAATSGGAENSASEAARPSLSGGGTPGLALMLLYAFIGGLILNVMPCVLPVIALKILGFVSEARSEPRRVRNLGLLYAVGVLASFLALAAIVIAVNAAGHRAGWGMQFGNPVFVVCLTTLVTLVALNLFGVFEVTPGGAVMDAAGKLAGRAWGARGIFQRCFGDGAGHALHGAHSGHRSGVRLRAKQTGDYRFNLFVRGAGTRGALRSAQQQSGAAEIFAEAGALDAAVQDGDGLSNAADGGLAFQRGVGRLRVARFLAGGFSGGGGAGGLDFRRIHPARPAREGNRRRGDFNFIGRRICLCAARAVALARIDRGDGRERA